MTRFVLSSPRIRANAIAAIMAAGDGEIVTLSKATRSSRSNALMWCLLNDLARAKPEGRQWTPETWKSALMHSLGHQIMFCEGLDGAGPFPMGFRSSQLNAAQMGDLIMTIQKYGDEHGVKWTETEKGGFMDLKERAGE